MTPAALCINFQNILKYNNIMFALWLMLILGGILLARSVSSSRVRKLAGWALIFAAVVLLVLGRQASLGFKLLSTTVLFLFAVKGAVLLTHSKDIVERIRPTRMLLFSSLWPGMDVVSFTRRVAPTEPDVSEFGKGLGRMYAAAALLLALAVCYPELPREVVGWGGITALLLLIHLGFAEVLCALLRLAGIPVEPLFRAPLSAKTLHDFWSLRWNRPYVEMNRRLFLPSLVRCFKRGGGLFGVFIVSGLLHEMALSYPSGGGYGGPLLYFSLQGILVLVEQRARIQSPAWTWICLLLPLPILFHGAFRSTFILPLVSAIHTYLAAHTVAWYLGAVLWVLGVAQFLVLFASYQVPRRLRWKEELPRLCAFNQKLMYSYGGFIVLCIFAFGVLTLSLHSSFLAGERSAVGLALFMTAFWLLRLIVDFFYYKAEDWPQGPDFVIGHALLNSLFVFLTLGYGFTAAYGLWLEK